MIFFFFGCGEFRDFLDGLANIFKFYCMDLNLLEEIIENGAGFTYFIGNFKVLYLISFKEIGEFG